MVGSGENIHEDYYLAESIQATSGGASGLPEAQTLAVETLAAHALYVGYLAHETLTTTLSGQMNLITHAWPHLTLTAPIHHAATCGGNLRQQFALADIFDAHILYAAAFHAPPILADAAIQAQITTRRFLIDTILLDITIPPGGTLTLDSDAYTVRLDGADVTSTHDGAWLRLDRNIYDVALDVAYGRGDTLDARLAYTPKWL